MVEGAIREVLLAEDNATNQMVFRAYLGRLGARATIVPDGAAAVRAYAEGAFDVVLMDLQMPVMGGPEAARAIRAIEAASGRARTPILALTAETEDEARTLCAEAGMDGHLAKPATLDALARALAGLRGNLAEGLTPAAAATPSR